MRLTLPLCLAIIAITLLTGGISQARHAAPWDIEALPGKAAPAFSLTDFEGKEVGSTSLAGKVRLINFWATWCAPCREEMPALNALQQQFKDKGLTVVGINIDSDKKLAQKFIGEAKLSFLTLHDPELTCHDAYQVYTYPTTFLIDRKGVIQQYWLGPQEWTGQEFKQILEKYLH